MKKIFFAIVCLTQAILSDWTLDAIYNESDLKLDGAYRLKKGGKRKGTYLDKKIHASNQSKPVTLINYKIFTKADNQGYLCIVLHDAQDEKYELFFDSQPSHAIEWQRSKTMKFSAEPDLVKETGLYARTFLKHDGHEDVKANYAYEDSISLDLIIKGKNGNYSLQLGEPVR